MPIEMTQPYTHTHTAFKMAEAQRLQPAEAQKTRTLRNAAEKLVKNAHINPNQSLHVRSCLVASVASLYRSSVCR